MFPVPRRSIRGCMTCKQRKKKCDETRPICQRCTKGGFDCLGYDQQHTCPNFAGGTELVNEHGPSTTLDPENPPPSTTLFPPSSSFGDLSTAMMQENNALALRTSVRDLPRNQQWHLDPTAIDQIIPLIVSQYAKVFNSVALRPPTFPIENGLMWRIKYSDITRWSMFIGSKIMAAIAEGNSGLCYLNWITRFHQYITETPPPSEPSPVELEARLSGMVDIASYALMLLGTPAGYQFFKHSVPSFLQLAIRSPELWSNNSAILITAAIQTQKYDISRFIIFDTLNSLVLGVPPLLYYDSSALWVDVDKNTYMEWVYGFPAGFIVLVAKLNSWRMSRMTDRPTMDQNEWQLVENRLRSWNPRLDSTSEASQVVVKLAIQECWRHAILIYLYMGMTEVNSMDPRVETAVRQIVLLSGTIEQENPLGVHALIPCLIAGAVARREKHRASLRKRLIQPQNIYPLIVREVDFVAVLDHLWHNAASGGNAIVWEDYVQARCLVMPIAP